MFCGILGAHGVIASGYKEVPMDEQIRYHIGIDPKVMVGKPVIRGTRIPVELIVRMLAQGISESEILHEYPRLHPEDIRAALAYAAEVLAHEDVFPCLKTRDANSAGCWAGDWGR
jgi:uncharacterized protein (DUF433 family)